MDGEDEEEPVKKPAEKEVAEGSQELFVDEEEERKREEEVLRR